MNKELIELNLFLNFLYEAFLQTRKETHLYWVPIHSILKNLGISHILFQEKLKLIEKYRIEIDYKFGFESDCPPLKRHQLRNKLIYHNYGSGNVPVFIMQMEKGKYGY